MANNKKQNEYCTFDDLFFDGDVAQQQFENGWGVSVLDMEDMPGCYEIAVLDRDGNLNYTTDITYDVIRVENKDELNRILQNIQNLDANGKLPHEQSTENVNSADSNTNTDTDTNTDTNTNKEELNEERSQMRQVRCSLMRATSQNGSRAAAIASLRAEVITSFSTITVSTPYPPVAIAAMMSTEALVVRDNTTDISLVPTASRVYENALRNHANNHDVRDVARDSTNNILINTAEQDLPNVQMYLSNIQNLLDQSNLRFNNNRQIPDIEIPASSRNCMQTKYGAIDPITEERTGHVLFQTPGGNHILAPKKNIPDEYLDENGNFVDTATKGDISIRAKNSIQETKQDKNLTSEIINALGNKRWNE